MTVSKGIVVEFTVPNGEKVAPIEVLLSEREWGMARFMADYMNTARTWAPPAWVMRVALLAATELWTNAKLGGQA